MDTDFHVTLLLVDGQGREISLNRYMLLIGDQREATEHMQQLKKDEEKITNNFTYGNYYGFFPEISRQGEQSWESQVQIPQAKGFGARK